MMEAQRAAEEEARRLEEEARLRAEEEEKRLAEEERLKEEAKQKKKEKEKVTLSNRAILIYKCNSLTLSFYNRLRRNNFARKESF
jgi:predicted  nucleic acid-binding Zn-ribbon protein